MTVQTSDSCGPDARASKTEIGDSTSTVRKTAYHGPDTRIIDMEIACWRIAVRTMCHPVWMMSLNSKDFSAEISENLFALLSVRTAHVHRPDGA